MASAFTADVRSTASFMTDEDLRLSIKGSRTMLGFNMGIGPRAWAAIMCAVCRAEVARRAALPPR